MAKRSDKKHIRKITKIGGHSLAITLPIAMARELKWRERQKVVVKRKGKSVVISDWKSKKR